MSVLRPFIPGTSPCDGDCPLEWAAPALGVKTGTPTMMKLPEGTICTRMTYAKDGKPFVSQNGYYLTSDETGVGYYTSEGIMFRFDACQNWSLCRVVDSIFKHPVSLERMDEAAGAPQLYGRAILHAATTGVIPGSLGGSYRDSVGDLRVVPDRGNDSPPPAPVPLPSSGLMLAVVLLATWELFRRA